MYYLICCIVSFALGCLTTYLISKYISIEVKIKKADIKHKVFMDCRLQKIQTMLEEIKRCGTIPVKIPKAAEKSLMLIAQTKDWDKQIDEETIRTLNKIYNAWQMHIESEKKTKMGRGAKTGDMQGYKKPKWEGTYKEYLQAVPDGKITPDTEITITDEDENIEDYHGSWITMNDDGSIEEYME